MQIGYIIVHLSNGNISNQNVICQDSPFLHSTLQTCATCDVRKQAAATR